MKKTRDGEQTQVPSQPSNAAGPYGGYPPPGGPHPGSGGPPPAGWAPVQPGYGGAPYPPPPQPPRKSWFSRHKFLTALLAFGVLIVFAVSVSGNDSQSGTNSGSGAEGQQNAVAQDDQPVGLNTPVRDGDFQLTVRSVDCSKTTIGDNQFTRAQAQGKYCQVPVVIENVGKEGQSVSSDALKLVDANGNQHATDSDALLALGKKTFLFEQINPGNKISETMVFDVPKDAQPSELEFKSGLLTDGVRVKF